MGQSRREAIFEGLFFLNFFKGYKAKMYLKNLVVFDFFLQTVFLLNYFRHLVHMYLCTRHFYTSGPITYFPSGTSLADPVRDCQQITFVTLSRFCSLSNPLPHPLFLNGQNQDGWDTKHNQIKIRTLFTLHFKF